MTGILSTFYDIEKMEIQKNRNLASKIKKYFKKKSRTPTSVAIPSGIRWQPYGERRKKINRSGIGAGAKAPAPENF